MILYVNGDSHSSGAESISPYDRDPANLEASYGGQLSKMLNLPLVCDAVSGSSNERIMRTTQAFLETKQECLVVIGWTNWTRTEWFDYSINDYVQINATVPKTDFTKENIEKYKNYVADLDFAYKEKEWHRKVWALHEQLTNNNIPHLFFNANQHFNLEFVTPRDWGKNYVEPYNNKMTYVDHSYDAGFKHNDWYHYKADAHLNWANFLFSRLTPLISQL